MTTQIKITQLTNIGSANTTVTTLLPVVNMAGTPTTQKTTLGNLANVILSQSGGNYAPANLANVAYSVTNAAQPNITSVGTLTNVVVSGNASINGNITSNGTAYLGNISTTGLASITTLAVGATANLGAVGNVRITGGTAGQLLSTNGNGVLSWASDSTTYGNSNVVTLLSAFGSNTITTTGNVSVGNIIGNGQALTNIAGANVSGFVPNANVANTALAVAGANVSGAVSFATTANGVAAANVSGLGNIATANFDGNASNVLHGDGSWSADTTTYSNSNVASFLAVFGSNTITTTGNVSVGNITATSISPVGNFDFTVVTESANIDQTWTFGANGRMLFPSGLMIEGVTSPQPATILLDGNGIGIATSFGNAIQVEPSNITIVANSHPWHFTGDGNLTLPAGGQIIVSGGLVSSGASPAPTINGFSITNSVGISGNGNIAGNNISATGNVTANNFTGNGGGLSNVATKTTGSWTLASGNNTVSLSVPLSGTYTIWVNGNIPNGIITYTATAVVTNTNVPVLGEQYGWFYEAGNALVLTSIPNQFVGTSGAISNAAPYSGNTANVFTFGITNNSGNTAVVNYGYTKL